MMFSKFWDVFCITTKHLFKQLGISKEDYKVVELDEIEGGYHY